MNKRALSNCPVCGGNLVISRLTCSSCKTKLEGDFEHCIFSNLVPEEKEFIEIFLLCRGNIKEVEKRLGLSYPTIRNKLDSIVNKMEEILHKGDDNTRRLRRFEILEELKRNKITAEEAAMLLKEI